MRLCSFEQLDDWKLSQHYVRYYLNIRLAGLVKTTKNFIKDSQCHVLHMNQPPHEYKLYLCYIQKTRVKHKFWDKLGGTCILPSSRLLHHIIWLLDTNVLEEHIVHHENGSTISF
jgi:hypothetical protein